MFLTYHAFPQIKEQNKITKKRVNNFKLLTIFTLIFGCKLACESVTMITLYYICSLKWFCKRVFPARVWSQTSYKSDLSTVALNVKRNKESRGMYLSYTSFFPINYLEKVDCLWPRVRSQGYYSWQHRLCMTLRKLHWLRFAKLTRQIEAESHARVLKLQSLYFLDFALAMIALIIYYLKSALCTPFRHQGPLHYKKSRRNKSLSIRKEKITREQVSMRQKGFQPGQQAKQ